MNTYRFSSILKQIAVAAMISCSFAAVSCSSSQTNVEKKVVPMPTEYPTAAKQTLKNLASSVPADSDFLVFSSYGSIADSIKAIRSWDVVERQELDNMLNDLGTHFRLNPADLKSWFNGGFHTGSGFVAGYLDKNGYVVLDILQIDAFRSWLDNFINEEYGRPRYDETEENGIKYIHVNILNRDFATLVIEDKKPVLMVFGEAAVSGSPASKDAAVSFIKAKKLSENEVDRMSQSMSKSPIGFWTSTSSQMFNSLPEKVQVVKDWANTAGLELAMTDAGPDIRFYGNWNDSSWMDRPRGQYISDLFKGAHGPWAARIMDSQPTTAVRVLLNTKQIEELAMKFASEKQQSQYNDIKSKLTQRLIKLDVSEQVIYNMGVAWAAIYDAKVPANQNPSMMELLTAQNAAVYIPFKDVAKSNSFFSKVNILKSFIPENVAKIDNVDGILHIVAKQYGQIIHVGYMNGLLAACTESAWPKVKELLQKENAPASDSSLTGEQALAGMIKVTDMTTILGVKYAIIREQIANFLKSFDRFEIQSTSNASRFEVSVQGKLCN